MKITSRKFFSLFTFFLCASLPLTGCGDSASPPPLSPPLAQIPNGREQGAHLPEGQDLESVRFGEPSSTSGGRAITPVKVLPLREKNVENVVRENQVTVSFAGDTTLGTYYGQVKGHRFDEVYNEKGESYFFKNVYPIFVKDDLTIINLEGPLTDVGMRQEKRFALRGEPHYVNILKEGSVEVVSLANNHTYDYGETGYKRTKEVLEGQGIGYFGEDVTYHTDINGVNIALIGANGWSSGSDIKKRLAKRISLANRNADLVVVMFHWGVERAHYPNKIQKNLAYYAIDKGADLVVGAHPHVVQGIEKYKGKNIVYSLGNFSFGANRNPRDKDTFIYQETFKKIDGDILSVYSQVIPCRISSVTTINDYSPTPLNGKEGKKVMDRIKKYSKDFKKSYFSF